MLRAEGLQDGSGGEFRLRDGSHGWVEEHKQSIGDLLEKLFLTRVNQVRFQVAESLIEYKYTVKFTVGKYGLYFIFLDVVNVYTMNLQVGK